jgi:hypothetical protein
MKIKEFASVNDEQRETLLTQQLFQQVALLGYSRAALLQQTLQGVQLSRRQHAVLADDNRQALAGLPIGDFHLPKVVGQSMVCCRIHLAVQCH